MSEEKKTVAEILKRNGLVIAEDAAVSAVRSMFKSLPEILLATENKYDDMLIPVLAIAEKPFLALLDKIDGENNPDY